MNKEDLPTIHESEIKQLPLDQNQQYMQVSKKLNSEENEIESEIQQLEAEYKNATLTLERRKRELDLQRKQGERDALNKRHDEQLTKLSTKHTEEINDLQIVHQVDELVIELLSEVRTMKQLQPPARRILREEYIHTSYKEVLFKRGGLFGGTEKRREPVQEKRIKETELKSLEIPRDIKRSYVLCKPLDENNDRHWRPSRYDFANQGIQIARWEVGGQTSGGCTVLFQITLRRNETEYFFSVNGLSDANHSDSGTSRHVIQSINDMGKTRSQKAVLEKEALADMLLTVLKDTRETCPCYIDCDCACDCRD